MNLISEWLHKTFSDAQVVLLMMVIVGITLAIMVFGQMLAPAIAAIVIAFLLDGPVLWLQRKGGHPLTSVILVFIGFLLVTTVIILNVVPPLLSQVADFINDSPVMVARVRDALLGMATEFPDIINEEQVHGWFAGLGNEIANLGPQLLQYSVSGVAGAVTIVVYAVLVPVMVFFFLKDKKAILGWFSGFLPRHKPILEQVGHEIVDRAGDYARGKVYEIIIVATVSFVTYQLLGLRYATLLAVVTGLSVLIPYVGAATVTIPVALVAYFQWGFSSEMAGAVLAYLVLQALDGNLLAPLLFSEVVNLHPNAIIVAILVFGGIWGFWGVFFAIPLATVANAVIRAWRSSGGDNQSKATPP